MTAFPPGSCIEIGVSIEPLTALEQLYAGNASRAVVPAGTVANPGNPLAAPRLVQMAQRIGEGMFNYLMSFARPLGVMAAQMDAAMTDSEVRSNTEVVPVQRLQDWFNTLVKKATNDPEGFQRQYLA